MMTSGVSGGFNPPLMTSGSSSIANGGALSPSGPGGDDIPNDPGKMFIGGLSWQTTPESIREYFSAFGELAEVMVMKDPATRRSRGFGFITFSDPRSVEDVLKYPVHQLDGKLVEPKVAVPRKTNPKLVMRTRKIFVGGLSSTTSLEDIKAYFEQFSKVKEAMLAYDKITNRHRGFGFVTFDNEDVVDKICEIHFHEINGKMVESKKALPKEPRLGYYNNYGSPSVGGPHIGYGHFSPGRPGSMYSSYGGYGGTGGGPGNMRGNSGYPGQGFGSGQHHQHQQYNNSSYDHPRDQGSHHLLQMGHFDNANYGGSGGGGSSGYDNSNDMRYYSTSSMGKFQSLSSGHAESSFNSVIDKNNVYNKDFGATSSSLKSSGGAFSSYRENGPRQSSGLGGYENGRGSSQGTSQLDMSGLGMLSNGYYSSRDFVNGHHNGGAVHNNNNSGQPYSTSAGSGGSAENSAGYEDDFPELTTSKFNNLRLTDDVSPTSTPNDLSATRGSAAASTSAFVAF